MESIKVCKFGGSSVAKEILVSRIKELISSDDNRRIIVVSAPGKTETHDTKVTDLLISAYLNQELFDFYMDRVKNRFVEMIQALDVSFNIDREMRKIKRHFKFFKGRSYLISRGEYLTARIFADYLNIKFIDSAKIIKFDRHGKITKSTPQKIKSVYKKFGRFITPGFYGSNAFGKIKVMSRGGSDITGAIIAKSIDGAAYENWTDVDGLFNDFNIREKRKISSISYRDLQFLSFFGANVFHYKCCSICEGVETRIKNLFNKKSSGTIVMKHTQSPTYAHASKEGIEVYIDNNAQINAVIKKAKIEVLYNSIVLSKKQLVFAINKGYSRDKYVKRLLKSAICIDNVQINAYICDKKLIGEIIKQEHANAHIIQSLNNHHLIISKHG